MPGRKYAASGLYKYGFNGKENDNEVIGEGNQQDYGMRVYDPRLGKFLSVDPISFTYPWYTPYQFAGNTPIQAIDLDGGEPKGYPIGHPYGASHPGTTVKHISSKYDNQGWWVKIRGGTGSLMNVYAIQDIDNKTYLIFESASGTKSQWYWEYDKEGFKGDVNSFDWSHPPDPTNALLAMTVGPLVGLPAIVTGGFLIPATGISTSSSAVVLKIQFEVYKTFMRYAPTLGSMGRTVAEFIDESGTAGIQNAALKKLAVAATKNASASKVMLGKYIKGSESSYEKRAGNSYTYFELEHYNEINEIVGGDKMWDINRQFIDNAITDSKRFFFSHDPAEAKVGAFKNEIDYLRSKGFTKYNKVGDNLWEAVKN